MQDLVTFIVENIVTHPKEISVTTSEGQEGETLLQLKVSPEDMGLVIGKSGKVIKSIRNLLRTKAILENKRVNLVLADENSNN